MKVTALKQQSRNKARVNVYLDGEFALGLAKIIAARLTLGQVLDDAALERLRHEDEVEVAYERALHFLGPRPRSEAEIRRRLLAAKPAAADQSRAAAQSRVGAKRAAAAKVPARTEAPVGAKLSPEVVTAVLARLAQAGLVDDKAFADYWVDNRTAFRPRSKRLLRAELRQKGLGDEAVQAALAEVDETGSAYTLAKQRAGRFRGLEHQEFRRKLGAFLARRGFDFDTIEPIVERVWKELTESSES